jgi:DNA-binding CsgD family transcriptional regulator
MEKRKCDCRATPESHHPLMPAQQTDTPRDALFWNKKRISLTQPCLIGRGADNDIIVEDKEVSRRHAMIYKQGSDWWLSDLGSRNGIRVNSIRLLHARRLRDGDELELGEQKLRFVSIGIDDQRTVALQGETTQLASEKRYDSMTDPVLCELIVAAANGEILEGEKAARWFFGGALERPPGARQSFLPNQVCIWLGRQQNGEALKSSELELLDVDRRVIVNFCRCKAGRYFLLVREESTRASRERLEALGLSPREAEVMHWVSEGKTNSEIAIILEVTIHTVNRHVEHILSKLGVESRHKAMIAVQERAPRLR